MLKDYENGRFTRVHFDDAVDVLMNKQGSEALVIWPWWSDPEPIRKAMTRAHEMGFTAIMETGNYGEHRIAEVDCDDWDYALVVGK